MPPKYEPIYKIAFRQHDKLIELHAREIGQSDLFGFLEVGDFIFNSKANVVVDPSEEKLKAELAGVTRIYVPMHAVIRIDEVEKHGANKMRELKAGDISNVAPFPYPGNA